MLVVVSLGDTCRCQFAWMFTLGLVNLACPAIDPYVDILLAHPKRPATECPSRCPWG